MIHHRKGWAAPRQYLNFDQAYFAHPKTRALQNLLGRGSELLPLKVWSYAGRYFPRDGRLVGLSPSLLEEVCEWWGAPGALVEALLKTRFLDLEGETLVVHDWIEHQGWGLMRHPLSPVPLNDRRTRPKVFGGVPRSPEARR